MAAAFMRMKQENFRPARDLILALTADEETGPANGVDWLVKNHRSLIDAEFCINTDGGGGSMKNGKPLRLGLEAAEKVFVSYKLEVTNPGGHSSLPTRDNAIYHLAEGLARLAKYDFPVHLFDVTRASFAHSAAVYEGQVRSDLHAHREGSGRQPRWWRVSPLVPRFNAQMRTTCVATQVTAGHAENALPQRAAATVNCRILPVDRPEDVRRTLERVLADPAIHISEMNQPVAPPHEAARPARGAGGHRFRREAMARSSGDPGDGYRRQRQYLSAAGGDSRIQRGRPLHRRGRHPRARPRRTHPRARLLRRRRLHVGNGDPVRPAPMSGILNVGVPGVPPPDCRCARSFHPPFVRFRCSVSACACLSRAGGPHGPGGG